MAEADRPFALKRAEREMLEAVGIPAAAVSDTGHYAVNRSWEAAFGPPERAPWGLLSTVEPDGRDRVSRAIAETLETHSRTAGELRASRAEQQPMTMGFSVTPMTADGGRSDLALVVCWDLTGERRYEERLAFMAGHDPLTGLANRRALEDTLERTVARAQRGASACLALFDMDHFKQFNDHLGHLAGDQAIVSFAHLLRRHLRAGDLPVRMGGDEFAVLLEGASLETAMEVADRIRVAAASEEFVSGARSEGLGVSVGVASVERGIDVLTLVDRADAALYEAKRGGRGQVVPWTPELQEGGSPERMAERVRVAFANDGFCLHFQPVVRLDTGVVVYFEALVRMRADDGTLTCPSEFLPAVERLGLMSRLTLLVIHRAMARLSELPSASISVNLSAGDLGDEHLLDHVALLMQSEPTIDGRLLFELSESVLLSNLAGGRVWMKRLGSLGSRFVLDNFGTGTGMFVLLKEPGISQVKLSSTVMHAMVGERSNRVFVGALRELIETQGKLAVAEYLESEELLHDVKQAGFQLGQGFWLHDPAEDIDLELAVSV